MFMRRIICLAFTLAFAGGAFASADQEQAAAVQPAVAEVAETVDAGALEPTVATPPADEAAATEEPAAAVAKRADAKKGALPRQSKTAAYEDARVGFAGPASGGGAAKSAAGIVAAQPAAAASGGELVCSPGERAAGGSCARCGQKNNPGVIWANPGKDCTIKECASDKYLIADAGTENAKCFEKCDVWGGHASRAWIEAEEKFGVCGSGGAIECDKEGFIKTREQTAVSEMQYWHCIPVGTMSGACKKDGAVNYCEFQNTKARQICSNGFWSLCTYDKFCVSGHYEDKSKQVWTVASKKDEKSYAADCVKRKR
jgi:hypothetical protein